MVTQGRVVKRVGALQSCNVFALHRAADSLKSQAKRLFSVGGPRQTFASYQFCTDGLGSKLPGRIVCVLDGQREYLANKGCEVAVQ
jgi:hypothetical protein